jgi:hypothetical protein
MVSGIIKITYLGSYGKHGDFLYNSSPITIWTTAEICIAISAASAPCLKPLFRRLLHSKMFTGYYGNGSPVAGYEAYEDRIESNKAGIELQYKAQVSSKAVYGSGYGGSSRKATESEEEIVRPEDRVYVSRSVSVSVA